MLRKKLPSCTAVSAVTSLTVVSTIGMLFNLISNFDKILKYGTEAKKAYDNAMTLVENSIVNNQKQAANAIEKVAYQDSIETDISIGGEL